MLQSNRETQIVDINFLDAVSLEANGLGASKPVSSDAELRLRYRLNVRPIVGTAQPTR